MRWWEMDGTGRNCLELRAAPSPKAGRGLKPVIDARHPLDTFPAALDHLDRGAFG
jgi:hypothetical protein